MASTVLARLPSLSLHRMPSASSASSSPPLPPRAGGASAAATPSSTSVLRDEHALLAAYETRPTRPKRSSSERSKEFRAKRKKYEGELQHEVDAMRREVAELTMRRNIWQEKLVHMRSHVSGSLIKVVREYYLVFQHGLALSGIAGAASENPKAKYQLDFLRRSMDANVRVNDCVGIPTLVEMWRRYTIAHTNLFVEVGDVTLFGPDDDPVVLLSTKFHAQLALATFEFMFPTALLDEALVSKFTGKHVTYEARTYFRFNADGRIGFVDHDIGLFDGLLAVAPCAGDALQLMTHFQCSPLARWTIEDDESQPLDLQVKVESVEIATTSTKPHHDDMAEEKGVPLGLSEAATVLRAVKTESPSSDTESDDSESERRKHTMNFLLS